MAFDQQGRSDGSATKVDRTEPDNSGKSTHQSTSSDAMLKHLELVQSVICRMAENSFKLKGWSVALVSGLFALAAKEGNVRFAALALLPALTFWGMDAYYLRQERLYRALYDDIRNNDSGTVSLFSMATSKYLSTVSSWPRTIFSRTILALHGPMFLLIVTVCIVALTTISK